MGDDASELLRAWCHDENLDRFIWTIIHFDFNPVVIPPSPSVWRDAEP
jgi:hypothetical protein